MTESYVERFAREQKEKTEGGRKEQKVQKPIKKVRKNSVYGKTQKKEVKDDGKNVRDGEAESDKPE